MRRLVASILAAALLGAVAVSAFAAANHAKADLAPIAVSGVTGSAEFNEVAAKGETNVVLKVKGLQPNVDYTSRIFTNTTCTPEAASLEVASFRSNPNGMATIQAKLDRPINQIGSISVLLSSDQSQLACGQVVE